MLDVTATSAGTANSMRTHGSAATTASPRHLTALTAKRDGGVGDLYRSGFHYAGDSQCEPLFMLSFHLTHPLYRVRGDVVSRDVVIMTHQH
jgi:hypothetical protein